MARFYVGYIGRSYIFFKIKFRRQHRSSTPTATPTPINALLVILIIVAPACIKHPGFSWRPPTRIFPRRDRRTLSLYRLDASLSELEGMIAWADSRREDDAAEMLRGSGMSLSEVGLSEFSFSFLHSGCCSIFRFFFIYFLFVLFYFF